MGFNWIYWILMGFNGYANVPFLQTTPGDFRNLMELDSKKTFPYDLSAGGSIDVARTSTTNKGAESTDFKLGRSAFLSVPW